MTPELAFPPKSLSASEYVLALFEPTDNVAVLARNRTMGRTVQRITSAEIVAGPEHQSWLRNENSAGADIFIGMNPIKNGADARTKPNISEIRHLYLDIDSGGQDALDAIRNSSEIPAPNFVLDTSPGKHQVVWKVEGIGRQEAESMLRAMANQFGGDPAATDSTRVLRLPGFANKKYQQEFIVEARQESSQVYQARDFRLQDGSPDTARHLGDEAGRRIPQGHKSQSEQDWAYAKRALARGDDPALVIQRIADFRAEEKANPEYYARHTVMKAEASLRATASPPEFSASVPIATSEPSREP